MFRGERPTSNFQWDIGQGTGRLLYAPAQCTYILGNPPFVGKKQSAEQKAEMEAVWGDVKGTGALDFVTCWYRKAADCLTAAATGAPSDALEKETRGLAKEAGSAGAPPAVPGALAGNGGSRDASFAKHASSTSDVSGGAPKTAGEGARAPRDIHVAFVSTNSICQGEQASVLRGYLLSRYRVKPHFAHRTFP